MNGNDSIPLDSFNEAFLKLWTQHERGKITRTHTGVPDAAVGAVLCTADNVVVTSACAPVLFIVHVTISTCILTRVAHSVCILADSSMSLQ